MIFSKLAKSTRNIYKNRNPKCFVTKQGDTLKAVILDFSGTICDPHVMAPAQAFVQSFKEVGINVTMQEARAPMGLRKDLHIKEMLFSESVQQKWFKAKGRQPTNQDAKDIFQNHFIQAQNECIKNYTDIIPGTNQVCSELQSKYGIKIGSTTGFTRLHTDIILQETKKQGYFPDFAVAGDDIEFEMGYRPAPFMVWRNMQNFGIYDRRLVMKVDDTIGGVQEGLNAGVWTVGLYSNSNYTDVDSIEQWKTMTDEEKSKRIETSKKILKTSGAHYLAEDVNDLLEIVQDINKRIKAGKTP